MVARYEDGAMIVKRIVREAGVQKHSSVYVIGVHVRLGDIGSSASHLRRRFWSPTRDYLTEAMDLMASHSPAEASTVVFFVACGGGLDNEEDMVECKKMTSEAKTRHTVIYSPIGTTAAEDFAALSSCNASIMTTGTFGWWASFLAGGPVVAYASPVLGDYGDAFFDSDSFFPPDWILLEDTGS
jgi:galactoside 2-L-fucosyltransferase 1/2